MASVNLSGILSGVGSLLGADSSTSAGSLATTIVQNMAIGAVGAAGLAALNHPDVKSALLPFDPLNLAGKPASLNPAPVAAASATVVAPTITVSAFGAMPAATQSARIAAGYHIVAG